MTRPTFSKISPISASLTISGGAIAKRVAGDPDHEVFVVERPLHGLIAALAHGARPRGEIDAGGEPDGANIENVGQTLERHRRIGKERLQLPHPLEQLFVAIEIERRQTRRAGERMRRIGVAVEQLDRVFRPAA